MIVLDASHPDIFEFIDAKALEEDRGRALLAAGFPLEEVLASLSFQHANHSVRVSDEFMRLVVGGGEWSLLGGDHRRGPRDAAGPAGAVRVRRGGLPLWRPGLAVRRPDRPLAHLPQHGADLGVKPMWRVSARRRLGVQPRHAQPAVVPRGSRVRRRGVYGRGGAARGGAGRDRRRLRLSERAIERNARRLRQIGIGYTNLAALLLTLGFPYDSDAGRDWAAAITALMTGVAYRRSAELAAKLGPFAEFERNREPMLAVIQRHIEALRQLGGRQPTEVLAAARREWAQALELGRKHGFRNAQTTLIPPTGTVSLMLDCETTGIEPYYALSTVKHFADGGQARISSRAVLDGLASLGHTDSTIQKLSEYALDHGHLVDAPDLSSDERLVFQTATGPNRLSPMAQLQMVAAVQPFVSGGVSKTVLLSADASVQEIEDAFIAAWRLGLKAIALYRDGSKLGQPLTVDEA